jgi:hypothetical protein
MSLIGDIGRERVNLNQQKTIQHLFVSEQIENGEMRKRYFPFLERNSCLLKRSGTYSEVTAKRELSSAHL